MRLPDFASAASSTSHRVPRPCASNASRDFGLREERDVARDFPHRPDGDAERGGERREAIAVRVPRERRHREIELGRPSRSRPRGARSPSAASVPDAPPSWSTSALASARVDVARARGRARHIQPAALSPKVVGVACCIQVRPAITVVACARASAAARIARRARARRE